METNVRVVYYYITNLYDSSAVLSNPNEGFIIYPGEMVARSVIFKDINGDGRETIVQERKYIGNYQNGLMPSILLGAYQGHIQIYGIPGLLVENIHSLTPDPDEVERTMIGINQILIAKYRINGCFDSIKRIFNDDKFLIYNFDENGCLAEICGNVRDDWGLFIPTVNQ